MRGFIYILLTLPFLLGAQEQSIFDQMANAESNICTLKTDMKFLTNKKHIEEYVPSEFSIDGKTYQVGIRTRGNARKTICYIPPFKIKFDKEDLEVKEPNSFKMVNSCKNNGISEQLLIKEYMAYKIYRIVTPRALEPILLQLTYEPKVTFSNRLDTLQLAIMTMFEYMIGNTDWAMGNQHNCFVVRHKDGMPFPVPYDFDYSGLVNAEYAIPQASTPIDKVTTRFNRGRCMTEENFQLARTQFLNAQEEVMSFIEGLEALSKSNKKTCLKYISRFYEELENEKFSKRVFCRDCKEMIK